MKNILFVVMLGVLSIAVEASPYTDIAEACHNKDMKGCYELGRHFQQRKDYTKSRRYFTMACENGFDKACIKLGVMYHYGKGIKKNLSKASKYYKKVCDSGNGEGCSMMGVLEMKKKSGSTEQALVYFDRGCKKGDAFGCEKYAYYTKSDTYGTKDLKKSKESYIQACKLDKQECLTLATAYAEGKKGFKKDSVKARKYYDRACSGKIKNHHNFKSAKACYKLGNYYYSGKGVKRNYAKAKQYYLDSCTMQALGPRVAEGCNNLAVLYAKGKGVKKNRQKAKYYYRLSCEYGYDKACETFKSLK